MATPDMQWSVAVDQAAVHLWNLSVALRQAPPEHRLSALATLNGAYLEMQEQSRREAITSAREQGWPLRRIATALDCSHEQVRILAAS